MTMMQSEEGGWDDRATEAPYFAGGQGGDRGWGEYAGLMREAISPVLNTLEDIIRRTPIEPGVEQREVALYQELAGIQMRAVCNYRGVMMDWLMAQDEMVTQIIEMALERGVGEDERLLGLRRKFPDLGDVPMTLTEARELQEYYRSEFELARAKVREAKRRNCFYDMRPLFRWMEMPPGKRSDMPSEYLPGIAKRLVSILGLDGQNTDWAHIEAVTSRQIAVKFGGDEDENEKTRMRDRRGGGAT